MTNFFRKIWHFKKKIIVGFWYRIKPRWKARWVTSFIIWVLLLVYVGFGVYFGIQVYVKKSEDKSVIFASKIYPFAAATVSGNIVWVKDYYKQLNYIKQFSEKTKQPLPDKNGLRKQIIDQLLENRLLSFQAVKNGVRVSSKDIDDAYQKIIDESGGEANVQKVLRELYGMNEKEFKNLLKQQVIKEKFQNEAIAQVKVFHILNKDEAKANEVANKARSGEDWNSLAKTYSEDVKTRDNGGDLGWIARGNLVIDNLQVPEFENAAFKANKGEIFGPVKTQAGFQVGKLDDKKGKIQESYSSWLENLKKKTKIFILIK